MNISIGYGSFRIINSLNPLLLIARPLCDESNPFIIHGSPQNLMNRISMSSDANQSLQIIQFKDLYPLE
jgi:hypothetical protein